MNKQNKKIKITEAKVSKVQIDALIQSYGELMKQLCEGDVKNENGQSPMMLNPVNYSFLIGRADMLRSILTSLFAIKKEDIDELEERIRKEVTQNG